MEYGCGRCHVCLFRRQKIWATRLVLESFQHQVSHFVTLTYDQPHYPVDGSVSVREMQLYLKRLRNSVGPFRYYVCGDYGSHTLRAHYHAALYGVTDAGQISESWGKGFVHIGDLTPQSASYIVSYLTKGLNADFGDRTPPFSRMSLRPGIGFNSVSELSRATTSKGGAMALARDGDVKGAIRYDGSLRPIGRYLKGKLRESLGMDSGAPVGVLEEVGRSTAVELAVKGREAHEQVRLQDRRKAEFRVNLAKQKGKV